MESSTLEPTVTLTEALSGIVWASLSEDTKRVFAEVEEDAERTGLGNALRTLYRRLDSCTLEDALSAQIHFLDDDYLPDLDPDAKNGSNRIERTRKAILELDRVIDEIEKYKEAFNKECELETSRIHAIEPPMRIGRYLPNSVKYIAYSVAVWAREHLQITIPQWDDLSQYDLFDSELDQEKWTEDARIEARLKVLNALVEGALNAEIPDRSNRIPKKRGYVEKEGFRPTRKKNPSPAEPISLNVNGIKDFIEWQFLRISGDENIRLLSKDPPRELLDQWSPESPFSSTTVNLRRRPLDENADLMIAGLAVGLAEDQFAEDLKKAKPIEWQLPPALTNIQWDAVDGVSEATVKRIVQQSIDKLLKRAKRP